MKLLLTSAGLMTLELRKSLADLIGKPASESTVVYVPTAANLEPHDKRWLIKDLRILVEEDYKVIDIVDISALPKSVWLPRLGLADAIIFGGGNTHHLLYWIRQSGLVDELPKLLKKAVYMGISAGSIVAGPSLALVTDEAAPAKAIGEDPGDKGLGLVPFVIEPHFKNAYFPMSNQAQVEGFAKRSGLVSYLLDDTSAVIVRDDTTTVVGEEHYRFE